MKRPLTRDDVLQIARAQKFLLWTVLLMIGTVLAFAAFSLAFAEIIQRRQIDPSVTLAIQTVVLATRFGLIALQVIAVIRLCRALKEGWATIIYVIFQFVPCLSLILLLFLNSRATSRLRQAGIRVGLMGARRRDLDNYNPPSRVCANCGEPLDATATACPLCGGVPT